MGLHPWAMSNGRKVLVMSPELTKQVLEHDKREMEQRVHAVVHAEFQKAMVNINHIFDKEMRRLSGEDGSERSPVRLLAEGFTYSQRKDLRQSAAEAARDRIEKAIDWLANHPGHGGEIRESFFRRLSIYGEGDES